MRKFLLGLLLAVSASAGAIVSGLAVHNHSAANLGGSTLAPATLTATGAVTFTQPITRVYTAGTTWTKPANLARLEITVIGGGGGGGGASNTGASQISASSGGAAGGYCFRTVAAASLGATETVTVGAVGSGGAAATIGTAGGNSSFGTWCVGNGGAGGPYAGLSTAIASAGSVGGTATSGDLNYKGMSGGVAIGASNVVHSGFGASTVFGGGAPAVSNAAGVSADSTAYGAGGSGGSLVPNNGSGVSGGNGAGGMVMVREFYQ